MNMRRRPLVLGGAALFAAPATGRGEAASAAATTRVALDRTLRAHPHLQYGAQKEPGKRVRVIVQKTSRAASSHDIARGAGSAVLREFPLVKGFLLEVPQQAVLALARNPNVRYVSPDGPVRPNAISEARLKTTYTRTVRAGGVWNSLAQPATGKGVTVAVVDTGVNAIHPDLVHAGIFLVVVNPLANGALDGHGHGTHVAGVINGRDLLGRYIGVAPDARVISVKVADNRGADTTADLLRGLQWVFDNRASANIRVVNVSLARQLPGRLTDLNYIKLSGTSMAAPVVTGAIALLLERYPKLTPDQIKWLLTSSGVAYPGQPDSARALHALAAMKNAGGPRGSVLGRDGRAGLRPWMKHSAGLRTR